MSVRKSMVRLSEVLQLRAAVRLGLRQCLKLAHSQDVVDELVRAKAHLPEHHIARITQRMGLVANMRYDKHAIKMRVRSEMDQIRLDAQIKESWTVDWIEKKLAKGGVLYDIGANVGGYSLIAAKVAPKGSRVIAFEPSAANFVSLCENVVLNGLQEVILPLEVALSDADGPTCFAYENLESGAALHSVVSDADERKSASFTQHLLRHRLDTLRKTFELPAPTLLKLDVDGHELAVLDGAKDCLACESLTSILAEVDKDEQGVEVDVAGRLAPFGFREVKRFKREFSEDNVEPPEYVIFERAR